MCPLLRSAAALAFLAISCSLSAQTNDEQIEEPKLRRFDFTPLIGYRTSIRYSVQPEQSNARIVFDANPSYGLSFGVRLNEQDLVEFRWARQDTYFHSEEPSQTFTEQRTLLDQFHGDFTHEYILEEWRWGRPYIIGSVGATRVGGTANSSFTRFSFGLGTGIKVFVNRNLGFRVQAEWLPIWVNPEVQAFVCGSGCVVQLGGTISSQAEITLGPVLRF